MPRNHDAAPRQERILLWRLVDILRLLSSNWAVFSFSVTVFSLAIGWSVFRISPYACKLEEFGRRAVPH